MADVSAPEIAEAYEDVRKDKSETNWLLITYESDRSDKLKLAATGTDGLEGVKKVLPEGDAAYAYVRVSYSNDKESTRHKFCLVTWIGPNTRVMRKAKVSVHAADVKRVLKVYSLEVAAENATDLAEEPIVKKLRKAGGASYDGV
ncbi:actin depolymerizing protein [Clavulina sp. PMI_390]|nr:actin depolymerizing protein [Clavulina sp. PMI_390]